MRDRYAKNSSTSCAAPEQLVQWRARRLALLLSLALVLALLPTVVEAAKKGKDYDRAMLINPFLGPQYARWLVGPVARIATAQEVESFLAISEDAEAETFIETFWQSRQRPEGDYRKSLREIFQERVAEADHQYTEGGYQGSRTDRGTILVLYGPPEKVDYEVAPWYGGPPIEVWTYAKDAEQGLDGEKPGRRYEFIEDEGHTVFYVKSYHDRKGRLKERPRLPRDRPY